MTGPVAFIDTETLGLDADVHPVWEIGLILPTGAEHLWQVVVTPRERTLAHPKALEIGRFEERYDHETALTPSDAAFRLYDLIADGTHLAGAVVSFDEERLRRLMWCWGYPVPWHYHLIDVETLAAGALRNFARNLADGRAGLMVDDKEVARQREAATPPWDSEELSRAVGVEPDTFDRHTALGDARWAKAIYEAVMGG